MRGRVVWSGVLCVLCRGVSGLNWCCLREWFVDCWDFWVVFWYCWVDGEFSCVSCRGFCWVWVVVWVFCWVVWWRVLFWDVWFWRCELLVRWVSVVRVVCGCCWLFRRLVCWCCGSEWVCFWSWRVWCWWCWFLLCWSGWSGYFVL